MEGMQTVMEVSTGHITLETSKFLDEEGLKAAAGQTAKIFVAAYEYGWFVWIPEKYHGEYPSDLADVLEYAKSKGAAFVNLDCDAITYDDLKSYEW